MFLVKWSRFTQRKYIQLRQQGHQGILSLKMEFCFLVVYIFKTKTHGSIIVDMLMNFILCLSSMIVVPWPGPNLPSHVIFIQTLHASLSGEVVKTSCGAAVLPTCADGFGSQWNAVVEKLNSQENIMLLPPCGDSQIASSSNIQWLQGSEVTTGWSSVGDETSIIRIWTQVALCFKRAKW